MRLHGAEAHQGVRLPSVGHGIGRRLRGSQRLAIQTGHWLVCEYKNQN